MGVGLFFDQRQGRLFLTTLIVLLALVILTGGAQASSLTQPLPPPLAVVFEPVQVRADAQWVEATGILNKGMSYLWNALAD